MPLEVSTGNKAKFKLGALVLEVLRLKLSNLAPKKRDTFNTNGKKRI